MSFLDKLKQKADELDLETKAKQLQEAAAQAAKQAQQKAGEFTAENREKIDGYVERASSTVDEKTHGKYHDQVAKVRAGVEKGVDWVAQGGSAAGGTGAAAASGVTEAGPFPADPESPTVNTSPSVADASTDARPFPADPESPTAHETSPSVGDPSTDAGPTRPAGSPG